MCEDCGWKSLLDDIDEMLRAFQDEKCDQVIVEAGDAMNFLIGIVSQAMTRYRAER